MNAPTLTIDDRFNGPPASANGGYAAGSMAALLDADAVEVTLRAPPPLGRPLQLLRTPGGGIALQDGATPIADAVPTDFELAIPPLPSIDEAEAAGALGRLRASSRTGNPYARCFGCGVARTDGLRIIPSEVGEAGVVAATWTPGVKLAAADGTVPAPVVWAALDCPAGIAWNHRLPDSPPLVTGRITARIDLPLVAGERYRVLGWPIAREGRKLHAGTAIIDDEGRVRAQSLQLWLLPRQ
jgi:hypothetical protein